MRNYDSSEVGVPYTRIPEVVIDYPMPLTAIVNCTEVDSLKLADGELLQYGSPGQFTFQINPNDMGEVIQLVDPTTGHDIPGATMTVQQIMIGILGVIRSRQKLRDAA